MNTLLLLIVISATAYAQEQNKILEKSEILKISLIRIRVIQGFEKNWQKCFGTDAPDFNNFLDVPTLIVTSSAIKQLKDIPTEVRTCEEALNPSYFFSPEAVCLLDEKVSKDLHDLTDNVNIIAYLSLLEKKTAEMNTSKSLVKPDSVPDSDSVSDSDYAENAKDMLEFFRKFNKKKITSMPKKKK